MQTSGQMTSRPIVLPLAWGFHVAILAAAAIWLTRAAPGQSMPPPWPPTPVWIVVLWYVCLAAMALAPLWPALAVLIYGLLATLVARYEPGVDIALNVSVLEWVTLLGVTGTACWSVRTRRRPTWPRGITTWLLLALVAWIVLTSLTAFLRDGLWRPAPEHHPRQFWQALVMFILAAEFLSGEAVSALLALVLCLALNIRGRFLSPNGVWLQEDIASLIVIALPLVILGIVAVPHLAAKVAGQRRGIERAIIWIVRVAFVAMVLNMLLLLKGTENRTAAVALLAVLAGLWLVGRHKVLTLTAGLPVLALGVVVFWSAGYAKRFTDLWTGGRDAASATVREQTWQAGWRMFMDHPLTGIGPGNFPEHVGRYAPALAGKSAHNHVINMLAETGLPGAILYLAFFAATLGLLWRTLTIVRADWPAAGARVLFASLCGYLAVGCFITRHDLVLAYLLAGWALGLSQRLTGRGTVFRSTAA